VVVVVVANNVVVVVLVVKQSAEYFMITGDIGADAAATDMLHPAVKTRGPDTMPVIE